MIFFFLGASKDHDMHNGLQRKSTGIGEDPRWLVLESLSI